MSRTRVIPEIMYSGMVVTHNSINDSMEYINEVKSTLNEMDALGVTVAVQALVNTIIAEETKLGASDVEDDNN